MTRPSVLTVLLQVFLHSKRVPIGLRWLDLPGDLSQTQHRSFCSQDIWGGLANSHGPWVVIPQCGSHTPSPGAHCSLHRLSAHPLARLSDVAPAQGTWLGPGQTNCRRGGGTYLAGGALGCLWLSRGLLVLGNVGHGSLLAGVAACARNLRGVSPKDAPRGLGSAG